MINSSVDRQEAQPTQENGRVYIKLCHFGQPRTIPGRFHERGARTERPQNGRVDYELCHC